VPADAGHRQAVPTPSDGPHTRPAGRLSKAFGQRRARFAMHRIATAHAPQPKTLESRLSLMFDFKSPGSI